MERIKEMRRASYLLPDPGGEVVRDILDSAEALLTRHAALVEATKNLRDSQVTLMRVTREHYTPKENMEHDDALAKYRAARAEVNRLIAEGEG